LAIWPVRPNRAASRRPASAETDTKVMRATSNIPMTKRNRSGAATANSIAETPRSQRARGRRADRMTGKRAITISLPRALDEPHASQGAEGVDRLQDRGADQHDEQGREDEDDHRHGQHRRQAGGLLLGP